MHSTTLRAGALAAALCLSCVLLTACGGGGGGGGSASSSGGSVATGTPSGGGAPSPAAPSTSALSLQVTGLGAGQSVTLGGGSSPTTLSQNGTARLQVLASNALSITQQPSGQTCELELPGVGGTVAGGTYPSLTVATSLALSQIGQATVTVDCSVYPALSPTLPQVGPSANAGLQGGNPLVMPNPILTPVFFSNDPAVAQTQETSFLQQLVASSLWSTLAQYGVGGATVSAPILLTTPIGSSFQHSTTDNLLINQAASWEGGVLDSRHFFVFFLPNGTALDLPGAAAYHTGVYVGVNQTLVPYAVVPLPSNAWNQIATQHEVMEGVADPNGYQGYAQVQGSANALWAPVINGSNGTEIGDMCEMYTTSETDLPQYIVQPIWSNLAAASFQNPCVPPAQATGSALFGAVPAASSLTTLTGAQGSFSGVLVKAGASVTIPLQVFSTSPSVGAITLGAGISKVYTSSATSDSLGWSFHFDRQGINGDTINLTITAPADAGPGAYVVDLIAADNQGKVRFWPLAVSTSMNYS